MSVFAIGRPASSVESDSSPDASPAASAANTARAAVRPAHAVGVVAGHIFAAALLLYVWTSGGSLSSTDAVVTFELTRSLVERHSIALPGNMLGLESNRGIDGRYYSQYGIGQSIYNIPFYLAGRAAGRVTGLHVAKADSLEKAAVAMGSAVAAAGTVATVFILAWLMLGRMRPSVIAAAACGIGSLLWPYARLGFNAPLAAWLLTAATAFLYAGIRRDINKGAIQPNVQRDLEPDAPDDVQPDITRDIPRDRSRAIAIAIAGAIVGAGSLTRHEFLPLAVPFIVALAPRGTFVSREQRDIFTRRLALFLPGVTAGVALWAIYNIVRFGSPWIVGYVPWYSPAGYFGLLLSPAGSIFMYSPAVILGLIGLAMLARRDARAAWLLGAPALCLFLLYGALDDWSGGRSYGPRYLVPVLPVLVVPIGYLFAIASRRARHAIVAAIALSALVQLPGVLVDYSRISQIWARTASHDDLVNRRYSWSASPMLLDSEAALEAMPRTAAYLTGRAQPPHVELTTSADQHDFSQQFAFSLDFWWLYLFYLGVLPAAAASAIGLFLIAASAAVAIRAWRLAARIDRADQRN